MGGKKNQAYIAANEQSANKSAAKVMFVTFFIFVLIYILNMVDVFTVDDTTMTIAFALSTVALLTPSLLVLVLKLQGPAIKYINVVCAVALVFITTLTLTYHVVMVYVYAIAIASLYFSKKLNVIATVLSVICVSVGQFVAFKIQVLPDANYPGLRDVLVRAILPRALILIALAAIFTMLCKRTEKLLGNLMGAAEQQEILESIARMQEKSKEVSGALLEMVTRLSEVSEITADANQRIAEEAESLLNNTSENEQSIKAADEKMEDVAAMLVDLSDKCSQIEELAQNADKISVENKEKMSVAVESINSISETTKECSEVIVKLEEQSKEIVDIVSAITGISNRTNMLALNASIEAARAGEQGKGFAVVAKEISKLAEQTKEATSHIGDILKEISANTLRAKDVMEKSVELTVEGKENIESVQETSEIMFKSNQQIAAEIANMSDIADNASMNGKETSKNINDISGNVEKNCNAVESMTAATQENTAEMGTLFDMVEKIKDLAQELNSSEE